MKAASPAASAGVGARLASAPRATARPARPAPALPGREPLGLLMQLGGATLLSAQLYLLGAVLLADPWNVEDLAPLLGLGALRSTLHLHAGRRLTAAAPDAGRALAAYVLLAALHAALVLGLTLDEDASLSLTHALLLAWALLFWPLTLALLVQLPGRPRGPSHPLPATGWVTATIATAGLLLAGSVATGLLIAPAATPPLVAAALGLTGRAALLLRAAIAAARDDRAAFRRAARAHLAASLAVAALVAAAAGPWLAGRAPVEVALVQGALLALQLAGPLTLWGLARAPSAPTTPTARARTAETAFGQLLLALAAIGSTLAIWGAFGPAAGPDTAALTVALDLEAWARPDALLQLGLMAWAGHGLVRRTPTRRARLLAFAGISLALSLAGAGPSVALSLATGALPGRAGPPTPLTLLPLVLPGCALWLLATTRSARSPRPASFGRARRGRPPRRRGRGEGHGSRRSYSNSSPALVRRSQSK